MQPSVFFGGRSVRHLWTSGLLVAALAIAGCSTVTSTRTALHAPEPTSAGVSYFLPTRLAKLTATRTPVRLAELITKRNAKAAELTEAEKAAAAAKKVREDAEALLTTLTSVAAQDAQRALIDRAKGAETLADNLVGKLQRELTNLTWETATAEVTGTSCSYTAKVELLPAAPDSSARFVANIAHSPLRDDSLKIQVNASGLLTSADVVAADQTGNILVELAGAAAGLNAPVMGPMAFDPGAPAADDCVRRPRQFVWIFDPANSADITALNTELDTAKYPLRIRVPAADIGASGRTALTYAEGSQHAGLFYRSPHPVRLTLEQNWNATTPDWQPIETTLMLVPQAGPISFIPTRSSAFVKTTDEVVFVDGSIASWSAERPSELLEIVRLPVSILREIISVPAELFSLKVDYSTNATNLAEQQRLQMQQENWRRETEACVDRAVLAGTSAQACFSN